MKNRSYVSTIVWLALSFAAFLSTAVLSKAEAPVTPQMLVQKHLDSIGSAEVRNAAKTRAVQGSVDYKLLVGGSGQIRGRTVLASDARKIHILLKVDSQQYHGERFITNGDKAFVYGTYSDKTRSELGELIRGEDILLREGLLGGTLTTAWPLADLDGRKGRLEVRGIKKVDGADLLAATYRPKKSCDMDITLYFDPTTFHHVMSLYTVSRAAGLLAATDGGEEKSARQQETRYRIEEHFGDFRTNDGVTLPWHYELRFTEELQNGFTKSLVWDTQVQSVSNNVPIGAKNFELP
jgi:hypothetical protein